MKKYMFILLGVLLGVAVVAPAKAQTTSRRAVTPTGDMQKEKTMKALQNDVRDHEATKKTVGFDLTHFRVRQAIQDHKLVSRTHKMVDADSKRAKAEGIDHPIAKARRAVHAEDQRAKG